MSLATDSQQKYDKYCTVGKGVSVSPIRYEYDANYGRTLRVYSTLTR